MTHRAVVHQISVSILYMHTFVDLLVSNTLSGTVIISGASSFEVSTIQDVTYQVMVWNYI